MLRHAVSVPRSNAVAVLDVAKAFDSVNHDTRLRAAAVNPSHPVSSPVLYLKLFPTLIGSLASSWME
ncbi:hypothetical protein AAHC03_027103 [Spirometra sp. Aus1]